MAEYLVVVQAPAYRVAEGKFALESAFAEHLRMLRDRLSSHFDRLLLACPQLSESEYQAQKGSLAHIDEDEEAIELVELHRIDGGRLSFWKGEAWKVWRQLRAATARAEVVHSGIADDLWRPTLLFANVAAKVSKRPVLFHVDIDFRHDTEMYYQTGVWSRRAYLLNRWIYDPLKLAQLHLAPRVFDLVLLKSGRMVRDVGKGAGHVRNFYDTVHSAAQVLSDDLLKQRVKWLGDSDKPLQLVFFGRFVEYKGLDRSIRAVQIARQKSGRDIQLELIGRGDQEARLRSLIAELGLEGAVRIRPPVPYGDELFTAIRESHAQIATPLCEDTPRAAFDAFAQGLPIVAFGIRYYEDLEEESRAVVTGTWPEPDALAQRIVELDSDRPRLQQMASAAVEFAKGNTQEIWIDRRIQWTLELLEGDARR